MVYKIGVDFHGVISAQPQEFATFCHEIRARGVKVYIISGGPKDAVIDFLDRYNIEYDCVWAILDYCVELGIAVEYDAEGFHIPTEIWDKAKADYCAKERIQFHIDDSNVYGRHFVTPYCQYNISSSYCLLDNQFKVDFTKPKAAADKIAQYIMQNA